MKVAPRVERKGEAGRTPGKEQACDFTAVTELWGEEVSQEQVQRLCRRYYWAATYCKGRDVLEAACGGGQGLTYLAQYAKSLRAGDFSEPVLERARLLHGDRLELYCFDAQQIPFAGSSLDVVILFEALYYLPDARRFVQECRRILRPGGTVLVSTANKDLYDFNPSPLSYRYYGTCELESLFAEAGFTVACFGDTPLESLSPLQRLLRPVKKLAVRLGIVPKTMRGKKLLKRFIFGPLVAMPAEINKKTAPHISPVPLSCREPDRRHKVIFCMATSA